MRAPVEVVLLLMVALALALSLTMVVHAATIATLQRLHWMVIAQADATWTDDSEIRMRLLGSSTHVVVDALVHVDLRFYSFTLQIALPVRAALDPGAVPVRGAIHV